MLRKDEEVFNKIASWGTENSLEHFPDRGLNLFDFRISN